LEKYHDRITNLHLKDRTADGGNVPWGQGQTPMKEVLQLMKKEKWTFPAEPERSGDSQPQAARRAIVARQIELEYKIPEGSNAVAEVAKCVQYCKEALA
jgi:sugar phosphate isomerase/epimerase